MGQPDFIFVAGCNAAGKSSLIRSHTTEFTDYEVIMTDVYKGKSREAFSEAIKARKNVIFESPFNDESWKNLIDQAQSAGYTSSLITLFLNNPAPPGSATDTSCI